MGKTKKIEGVQALEINASTTKFLAIIDLLKQSIKYIAYSIMFYIFYRIVEVSVINLSGKSTIANIVFKFDFIWKVAAAGGTVWGASERILRKKQIKANAEEMKELRLAIDQKAGSSLLKTNGSNRKEDIE